MVRMKAIKKKGDCLDAQTESILGTSYSHSLYMYYLV